MQILPFEGEQERQLDYMPLSARFRFDCTGVRPSLAQWRALTVDTRRQLVGMALDTAPQTAEFRQLLASAIGQAGAGALDHFAAAALPWDAPEPPEEVLAALANEPANGPIIDWAALPRFYRYVLCKLATPSKAQRFAAALAFFGSGDA